MSNQDHTYNEESMFDKDHSKLRYAMCAGMDFLHAPWPDSAATGNSLIQSNF